MSRFSLARITGALFVAGAALVNVPYMFLVATFEYPDILREPAGEILTKFDDGGGGLIAQWFAFAWVGAPLLVATILLPRAIGGDSPWVRVATIFGVVSLVAQIVGLLRWTFVVPILADRYADPAATETSREATVVAFELIHQFGGVLLGEHIGQVFTIAWMVTLSVLAPRVGLPMWHGWFGIVAGVVYLSAQTELFETVLPGTPVVPQAGLVGSLLWLAWIIALGVVLMRKSTADSRQTTEDARQLVVGS